MRTIVKMATVTRSLKKARERKAQKEKTRMTMMTMLRMKEKNRIMRMGTRPWLHHQTRLKS